jgi:hypothetical protein
MNDEELKQLSIWYEQIDDTELIPDVSSDGHSQESFVEWYDPALDRTFSSINDSEVD